MNKELLKEEIIKAESGDETARAVVVEVLRPLKTDSIEQLQEKIRLFIRLIFLSSLRYRDAQYHRDIDKFYAEQIQSYLNHGKPKYRGAIIVGYRESAKTTRVKFNECYFSLYLPQFSDFTNVVSEDGGAAAQFNMDLFNTLGFSKIAKYFPDTIPLSQQKKKESQTMSRFTTTTGVTYAASGARKSKRGSVQMDIDEDGEVVAKRPKKVIFDDIENESTLLSIAATDQIYTVMNATIDGLDQALGFWVLLGNYLSLRGNVAKFLDKGVDNPDIFVLTIPIRSGDNKPTWEDKYTATDKEAQELAQQGVIKTSIESIERTSDNFEVEYQNNPKRKAVYFEKPPSDEDLAPESRRDVDGMLVTSEPEVTGKYVLSADAGKGVGKDESAFTVIRLDGIWYEDVATYRSKTIRPEDFASIISNTATKYNNALVIVENNYPGNEVLAFLRPIYKNLYKDEKTGDYGVNTNAKTKPEMFLAATKIMNNRLFRCKNRALHKQISEYPSSDVLVVNKRDDAGGHFDMLMSLVIGLAYSPSVIAGGMVDTKRVEDAVNRINNRAYTDESAHAW